MDTINHTETGQTRETLDLDRFRLRTFVDELVRHGEIDVRAEPMNLTDVAATLNGNEKAVWFKALGPERAELIGNVVASRSRIARAFGVEARDLLPELLRRLKNKPEIVEIAHEQAPVQGVVLTGEDIDLTKLPIHLQHGRDGGHYISGSVDYCIDPKTGWTNVGFRRLMLRGRRVTGVDLTAPSDLKTMYEAASARGEKLPVAFVIGCHPADLVAATMRVPVDELGLVSSMRGAALPVVKCVTCDIRVPADAEYVIEGYLDPRGHIEPEGPFGEFLGYYGGVKRNPLFHVTAITHRPDALFQTVTISGRHMAGTDTALLETVRTEVNVWQALESVVREPVAVYAPISTGGMLTARIALRQRSPGEARNAIYTVLASVLVKVLYVVDPDVDVFSDDQVEWAMATRFQPDHDLITLENVRSLPLDPSLGGKHIGGKIGFDLTWPYGTTNDLEKQAPAPPRFEGARFASLRAALEDGPKYFEELVASSGLQDGREVIRALEEFDGAGTLTRDENGRYALRR
jgi:2,5-furandicarboxylate decarboxylase 1